MGSVLAFDQAERTRRSNGSAAIKAGRKKIAQWLEHIEGLRKQKRLLPVYCVVARGLTNFPSATTCGYIWASQPTLAASIAVSPRTISRAISALKNEAALLVFQRGSRSARYVFSINGQPINDTAVPPAQRRDDDRGEPQWNDKQKTASASPDVAIYALPPVARLDASASPQVAMESCYSSESIEPESLPNPSKSAGSFEAFWSAIVEERGPPGPALRVWGKLSDDDRARIANLIGPNGIDLDRMWAVTWLKERRFEKERLSRRSDTRAHQTPGLRSLTKGSSEWNAERQRKIAAGESVALMDSLESWTIKSLVNSSSVNATRSRSPITEAVDKLIAELESDVGGAT